MVRTRSSMKFDAKNKRSESPSSEDDQLSDDGSSETTDDTPEVDKNEDHYVGKATRTKRTARKSTARPGTSPPRLPAEQMNALQSTEQIALHDRIVRIIERQTTPPPDQWKEFVLVNQRADAVVKFLENLADSPAVSKELSFEERLDLAVAVEKAACEAAATRFCYDGLCSRKLGELRMGYGGVSGKKKRVKRVVDDDDDEEDEDEDGARKKIKPEDPADENAATGAELDALNERTSDAHDEEMAENDVLDGGEGGDQVVQDDDPDDKAESKEVATGENAEQMVVDAMEEDGAVPSVDVTSAADNGDTASTNHVALPCTGAAPSTIDVIPSTHDVAASTDDAATAPVEMPMTDHTPIPQPEEPMQTDDPASNPVSTSRTLAQLIRDAVKSTTRKSLIKGDAAIISVPDDLSQTALLPSAKLFAATNLGRVAVPINPTTSESIEEVKYIFLLESDGSASQAPKLTPIRDGVTVEQLEDDFSPYVYLWRTAGGVQIERQDVVKTRIKALGTLLSILESPYSFKLAADASQALPRIEAVLAIALRLEAVDVLKVALDNKTLSYIANGTLYKAIASQAASWLFVGYHLRSEIIYTEAFRHVAGAYPTWEWQFDISKMPDQVLEAVKSRSMALRNLRDRIDNRLLLLFPTRNGSAITPRHAAEYRTGALFNSWLREHLTYLQQDEVATTTLDATAHPETSFLDPSKSSCLHHKTGCRTVAGFYLALSHGGDAYLPADGLIAAEYNPNNTTPPAGVKLAPDTQVVMRTSLADLKAAAARIVAPLLQGGMQFVGREKLSYLSVEVGSEGMPWTGEQGRVEGDDEDEGDDDGDGMMVDY